MLGCHPSRSEKPGRFFAADTLLAAAHRDGVFSAVTLLVAQPPHILHASAVGELHPGGAPAGIDTIYDLASLTKPVTAAALLSLVDEGRIDLNARVADILPDHDAAAYARVTLRQLATHISGLPGWRPLYERGVSRRAALVALRATGLESEPGADYRYSDLGYILLGECIARADGRRLATAVRRRVLVPAGMRDACYRPRGHRLARVAATGNCSLRPGRVLAGEVHDANAYALGSAAGHAGLFGTAHDVAALAAAILGHPTPSGRPLLSNDSLRLAQENQLPPEVGGQTIGWFTPPNPLAPSRGLPGPRVIGHTGFTGTLVACAPDMGLVVVLLTNRVLMPGDNAAIVRLRIEVLAAVYAALSEVA